MLSTRSGKQATIVDGDGWCGVCLWIVWVILYDV